MLSPAGAEERGCEGEKPALPTAGSPLAHGPEPPSGCLEGALQRFASHASALRGGGVREDPRY